MKNRIFQSRDLCLRALDTNSRCAKGVRTLAALEQGGDAQAIMQDLAWKLTNRLIHAPTKSLQQAARDGDNERLNILRDSLGLE